ncbi:MAG: lysoplasmalogenase [Lachnospiraceae bacterium]|nr:lysoplasmalogenase [Lachnospiraceae bacterium]
MIMYATILIVGFVYLILMIVTRMRGPSWLATVLKSFTSFFYLMTLGTAVLAEGIHLQYALFIGGGLLLGLLGDVWLDLKYLYPEDSDTWTTMGFLVFALGHFFYLAAVFSVSGIQVWAFVAGIIAALIAIAFVFFGEKPMHLRYGKFKSVSTAYGALLFFMAVYTLGCAAIQRNLGLLIMGIGGVFFLLSDLVLSRIYFGESKADKGEEGEPGGRPALVAVNYILYYIGQYMIASSVLWIGTLF